jgi:hypothetical protein
MDVGGHEDILLGDELHIPVISLLDERASRTEEIQELFGQLWAAIRPKAASHATAHDEAIRMLVLHVIVVGYHIVSFKVLSYEGNKNS